MYAEGAGCAADFNPARYTGQNLLIIRRETLSCNGEMGFFLSYLSLGAVRGCFYRFYEAGRSFLLMAAAMQAAPNPLSILTTARPGAQLLSIPSRAEKPPAPVP